MVDLARRVDSGGRRENLQTIQAGKDRRVCSGPRCEAASLAFVALAASAGVDPSDELDTNQRAYLRQSAYLESIDCGDEFRVDSILDPIDADHAKLIGLVEKRSPVEMLGDVQLSEGSANPDADWTSLTSVGRLDTDGDGELEIFTDTGVLAPARMLVAFARQSYGWQVVRVAACEFEYSGQRTDRIG